MNSTGHNGGPPLLDEEDAPKLRWVKVNIAEAIEGMEGLSMEERGFCWTGWLKMYARMGGFPADDQVGARIMGCDVRLYRRLRSALVSGNSKFYVEDGLLKNSRVEREIAEFCREHKRRREAALEREAKRRLQVRSGELLPDFSQTSPGLLPEVSNMFTAPSAQLKEIVPEKPNEIIVCTATTVAQANHSSGGTRTINQNHQLEREESTTTVEHDAEVGGGDVLKALNGTAIDITRFIAKFAKVDDDIARQMLGNNVRTFSSQAMLEAYAVTIAEMAEGLVAKPYKYMLEAARKIRDGTIKRANKPAVADESRRERIRRIAEETEANIRGRA